MSSARDRAASILPAALIAAAIPFVLAVRSFWWTCDDAFITFRYAKHLARGDGLIFNPGESPPVEGFTNLGWTLYLALFRWFDASLPLVANLTSALAGFGLIALVVIWVRKHLDGDLFTTLSTGLVLATLPPLAIWSTSGLETMPFAFSVFATFFFLSGEPTRLRTWLAAGCACDAALLRADGPLWIGFVFLAVLVPWFARGRKGPEFRAVITAGLVLTAVVAAQFLWRKSYFGQWVPNTASIKAGFSEVRLERGWKYLVSYALAAPVVLPASQPEVADRLAHLEADVEGELRGQRPLAGSVGDEISDVDAVDVLHRQEGQVLYGTDLQYLDHVSVGQAHEKLGVLAKTLSEVRKFGQIPPDPLHGAEARVLAGRLGEVDLGGGSPSELVVEQEGAKKFWQCHGLIPEGTSLQEAAGAGNSTGVLLSRGMAV